MKTICNFIWGRFGRKVLNRPYRIIWRSLWACIGFWLLIVLVQWWSAVVDRINWVLTTY